MGYASWIDENSIKHEIQFDTEEKGKELKKDLRERGTTCIKVEW